VGYADNTIAQMARRGVLERVSHGTYRIPFLSGGRLSVYMEAALWPAGVRGVLSHDTALDCGTSATSTPARSTSPSLAPTGRSASCRPPM
jgi:predicted transcriptional regulator of viral defense system